MALSISMKMSSQMMDWDQLFLFTAGHILMFGAVGVQLAGFLGVPVGILAFQTKRDDFGVVHFVTLDQPDYREKLNRLYLYLVVALVAIVFVSVPLGLSGIGLPHVVVSSLWMGVATNLATKRLADLNRAKALGLISVIPVFGHVFLIWLAYGSMSKRQSEN